MIPLTEAWIGFALTLARDYGLDDDLSITLPRKQFERLEQEVYTLYKLSDKTRTKGSPFSIYAMHIKMTFSQKDAFDSILDITSSR